MHKYRVRMGIDKARQHHAPATVDFDDLLAILLQPGIAQSVFRGADRNDLASQAEHGSVFDDAEFGKGSAASRAVAAERSVRSWPMLTSKSADSLRIPASLSDVHGRAIGMRTPVFFANSLASSYPASTCRITPMPGSVVSTRSMRLAIMSVPSATVTCPACSE